MAGINAYHLRHYIIRPVLKKFELWSPAAENLLMGTAAQESNLGFYVKQIGKNSREIGGPALGPYQMEPITCDDILENVVLQLASKNTTLLHYSFPVANSGETGKLAYDLEFATIMCRLHYCRRKEPLPLYDNIQGLARYWKKWYNTEKGKGKPDEFIANYNKYVRHSI